MKHQASKTLELQDKAGQTASDVLNAEIHMIERVNTGLFGILGSPSIVIAPSDLVWVTFTLINASSPAVDHRQQVVIKLKKSELGVLREGDAVLLDIIDQHICIGIHAVPRVKLAD